MKRKAAQIRPCKGYRERCYARYLSNVYQEDDQAKRTRQATAGSRGEVYALRKASLEAQEVATRSANTKETVRPSSADIDFLSCQNSHASWLDSNEELKVPEDTLFYKFFTGALDPSF